MRFEALGQFAIEPQEPAEEMRSLLRAFAYGETHVPSRPLPIGLVYRLRKEAVRPVPEVLRRFGERWIVQDWLQGIEMLVSEGVDAWADLVQRRGKSEQHIARFGLEEVLLLAGLVKPGIVEEHLEANCVLSPSQVSMLLLATTQHTGL